MDLRNMTLDQLYDLHTHLCDAHTAIHEAWKLTYAASHVAPDEMHDLGHRISAHITEVGDRIDSMAPRPLPVIDVPLAQDTTPPQPPLKLSLSDYVARHEDGTVCVQGDEIMDFRGDKFVFHSISRAPMGGKSAKVTVLRNGDRSEFYAQVFNLTVS